MIANVAVKKRLGNLLEILQKGDEELFLAHGSATSSSMLADIIDLRDDLKALFIKTQDMIYPPEADPIISDVEVYRLTKSDGSSISLVEGD